MMQRLYNFAVKMTVPAQADIGKLARRMNINTAGGTGNVAINFIFGSSYRGISVNGIYVMADVFSSSNPSLASAIRQKADAMYNYQNIGSSSLGSPDQVNTISQFQGSVGALLEGSVSGALSHASSRVNDFYQLRVTGSGSSVYGCFKPNTSENICTLRRHNFANPATYEFYQYLIDTGQTSTTAYTQLTTM